MKQKPFSVMTTGGVNMKISIRDKGGEECSQN